jgi:hypothetical protein
MLDLPRPGHFKAAGVIVALSGVSMVDIQHLMRPPPILADIGGDACLKNAATDLPYSARPSK